MGSSKRATAVQAGAILALIILAIMFGCNPSPSSSTSQPAAAASPKPYRFHEPPQFVPEDPGLMTIDSALAAARAQNRERRQIDPPSAAP
jgi:hypothetical protein